MTPEREGTDLLVLVLVAALTTAAIWLVPLVLGLLALALTTTGRAAARAAVGNCRAPGLPGESVPSRRSAWRPTERPREDAG